MNVKVNRIFDTISFLRFLGSPFISEKNNLPNKMGIYFYELSVRNSIPMLFLEQLRKTDSLGYLKTFYAEIYNRYLSFLDGMNHVSLVLNEREIEHAIFKTFRVYPSATGDIDVLIMGSDGDFKKASEAIYNAGYVMVGCGPQSITFRDRRTNIGIDVYREIAVSHLVYLDKRTLSEYIVEKRISKDMYFLSLSPAADLVSVIAHSVIKEQMLKLSDYYFLLYQLHQISDREIDEFIHLVRENHIEAAAGAYLTVTRALHAEAHRFAPKNLKRILSELNSEPLEELRLIKNTFSMPHKYHPMTLIKSLFEKIHMKKTRASVASQLLGMLEPSLLKEVINGVISHKRRESY